MRKRGAMTVQDAVHDAIRYYRYRGAAVSDIDSYARIRVDPEDFTEQRKEALASLERRRQIEKRGSLWFLHPEAFRQARGRAYNPEFQETDFCVLLAILGAGDDCDLATLIGNFDFIMRAIPHYDELYGALNRLYAARLIACRRRRFSPTPIAQDLFETARLKSKRSMYDQLDALTRLVLCPCCGVPLRRVTWRIALTEAGFKAAVNQYRSKNTRSAT